MSGAEKDANVRAVIRQMMSEGLVPQTEPYPETDKAFARILVQLRAAPRDDLPRRLVIAGFVNKPYGPEQQRCMECMYFLVHRRWCDLPELAVPVEAEWWCRSWRI